MMYSFCKGCPFDTTIGKSDFTQVCVRCPKLMDFLASNPTIVTVEDVYDDVINSIRINKQTTFKTGV